MRSCTGSGVSGGFGVERLDKDAHGIIDQPVHGMVRVLPVEVLIIHTEPPDRRYEGIRDRVSYRDELGVLLLLLRECHLSLPSTGALATGFDLGLSIGQIVRLVKDKLSNQPRKSQAIEANAI
jgi:hypothetical protein